MNDNKALWLSSPGGRFSVGDAPMPAPGASEVAVRVRAVALNPVDAISGVFRRIVMPRMPYPAVMGSDVAGEIVAVGSAVTRLRPGDRVVGMAAGQDRTRNDPTQGAFQHVVALSDHLTTPIPAALSYEQAAVLPLGLSTAAAGLFEPGQLALALPRASATAGSATGDGTVLVWGGSTSVGHNAIQLARNAGYDVIATASPHNHERLVALGAQRCFDYHDPDVVARIVGFLRGRGLAGTLAIGRGSLRPTLRIARQAEGTKRVSAAFPNAPMLPSARLARRHGIAVSGIWGGTPIVSEVGPAVFVDFLPPALADGRFVAAPAAEIVGQGLAAIPDALKRMRAGVSARKLVVTLP